MDSGGRVARFLAGCTSLLTVVVLLLGVYSYLDLERLKRQPRYASPEEAFVGSNANPDLEVTIDFSSRDLVTLGGEVLLSCDDARFVAGHYTRGGDRKRGGSQYLLVNDGWVRVSETSPTPLVVCVARKIRNRVNTFFHW